MCSNGQMYRIASHITSSSSPFEAKASRETVFLKFFSGETQSVREKKPVCRLYVYRYIYNGESSEGFLSVAFCFSIKSHENKDPQERGPVAVKLLATINIFKNKMRLEILIFLVRRSVVNRRVMFQTERK